MAIDLSHDVRYVPAWQLSDPKLEGDAIAMWREMRILPHNQSAEARAKELVSLAYMGDRLVGITTAVIGHYAPVRQRFAFMRLLIRPEAEKSGIAVPFTVFFREVLREWALAHPEEQLAGYGAYITVKGYGHQPVLPAGLALVGYTDEGYQVRLCWWDHFRIPVA
jgi:hypothetical protein